MTRHRNERQRVMLHATLSTFLANKKQERAWPDTLHWTFRNRIVAWSLLAFYCSLRGLDIYLAQLWKTLPADFCILGQSKMGKRSDHIISKKGSALCSYEQMFNYIFTFCHLVLLTWWWRKWKMMTPNFGCLPLNVDDISWRCPKGYKEKSLGATHDSNATAIY